MTRAILFEQKHRGHLWRLEVSSHNGRTFANWRKWFPDDAGWKPTREGLTFPLESLWTLTADLMAYHGLPAPERPEKAS